jgi:hypothetical protein
VESSCECGDELPGYAEKLLSAGTTGGLRSSTQLNSIS